MAKTASSVLDLIGNTPLVRLRAASAATGCEILGKCEFLNPGGSIKDRAAWGMIADAMETGALAPGGHIIEGTAGNTGIGLALVANALGLECTIVMPETQSEEKKDAIRLYGAKLVQVPAVPFSNPMNYARYSGQLAAELGGFWANQFDNQANRRAHEITTGPEIWADTAGNIDGFICAVGSGGTLAGVASALRAKKPDITIGLADPMGAALYHYYQYGELKSEGTSITEGIGQGRITGNLEGFTPDFNCQVHDEEWLLVLFDLMKNEGLSVGGSAALNVVGAMKLARHLGPGHTIVTMLCDYGSRYQSKLFNREFLASRGLPVADWL